MVGKRLAHYDVVAKIGGGGMGEVFRARDTKLDRDVAIKIIPAAAAADPQLKRRFAREAKAIAALKHPNIVTVYSVEETAEVQFITMELVEGKTLTDLLPPGGVPLERFFALAIPLADAVGYAHEQGIIHRDLKPANIMVDRDQRLKVLDFGLAKLWAAPGQPGEDTILADTQVTVAGHVLGTAAYMSPEQVLGKEASCRSDVFSLGVIFYELLAGQRPFDGGYPAETMHNIVKAEPARPGKAPDALVDIVARCLHKSPADRYASAQELRTALQEVAGAAASTQTAAPSPAPAPDLAAAGRSAFAACDWPGAYRQLRDASRDRSLTPAELTMLGTTAAWLGKFDECAQNWERAFAGYARAGDKAAAAGRALDLAQLYIDKNAQAVASGWQKQAERLLQHEPECREHGLLLRRQTMAALAKYDYAEALHCNRRCAAIADRCGDFDLQTVALHDRGQILIASGDVAQGTALVDEAMASAVSGAVDPATLGSLYCRTMVVCRSLADFRRVREWSEAAWRWSQNYPVSGYQGICRIHSAETMRHLGRWDEAERNVHAACQDFATSGMDHHAGEAFNELGELLLRRGDYSAAEEAFRRAHNFGHDPVPGLPLLRLAQRKPDAARQIITRALHENPEDRLRRAKLLIAAAEIALANDDVTAAEAAAAELDEIAGDFDCPCYRAHALLSRGSVQLARGDADAAGEAFRSAWSAFHELGFSYDAARAQTALARAYLAVGNAEDAYLQLGAAGKTFAALGAGPDETVVAELLSAIR